MMATLNAYLLYKEHCAKLRKKPVLHRVFRREVIKSLIGETTPQPTQVRGAANPRDVERLTGRHFLTKIVQKEGQKSKPLRTCPVCSTTTGKRKTVGDGRKTVRSSYEYVMLDCVWTLALNCITQKRTLSKPTTVYRNKMWKVVTLTELSQTEISV